MHLFSSLVIMPLEKALVFEDFLILWKRVLKYLEGNALTLKVLGSFFNGKSKPDWEKVLQYLPRISSSKIYNVLKISYDELDMEEKSLFLDIAFFFKTEDKCHVIEILDDSYIHGRLNVLVDRSLIAITKQNTLHMHDLLQEMGQEIVGQECSRLWYHEDVYHVLRTVK